jgi:hypothetical protein
MTGEKDDGRSSVSGAVLVLPPDAMIPSFSGLRKHPRRTGSRERSPGSAAF